MLIDSHCHLDYLARDGDLDAVLARARAAGIGAMITICTKLSEFAAVRDIAAGHDDVWCSLGVHPHEAAEEGQSTATHLVELARDPQVVGIGETGLDYYYEHSPRPAQQTSFRAHIAAARETGLPLIVHSRDADADTVAILQEEYSKGPFTGVIHCFTAGPDLARAALDIGFYISVAGIVTFKKAEDLRATLREVPLERLLVETDAPYLAPVPMRGKRNEPAFVAHTAAALAQLKDLPVAEVTRVTGENALRLFARVRPAKSTACKTGA